MPMTARILGNVSNNSGTGSNSSERPDSTGAPVAPPFDPSGNTALVGATMMFEILCVLAPAVHRRKHRMQRL